MFTKGDYIVVLENNGNYLSTCPINFCYQQRRDYYYLSVYNDIKGGENGWPLITFEKNKGYDWRYATSREIEEYTKLNQPFDITELNMDYEIY